MALLQSLDHAQARDLARAISPRHMRWPSTSRGSTAKPEISSQPEGLQGGTTRFGAPQPDLLPARCQTRAGPFYTAAINDVDVAALLKLRPQQDIAIGANGAGVPDPGLDTLHLKPLPWARVAG